MYSSPFVVILELYKSVIKIDFNRCQVKMTCQYVLLNEWELLIVLLMSEINFKVNFQHIHIKKVWDSHKKRRCFYE